MSHATILFIYLFIYFLGGVGGWVGELQVLNTLVTLPVHNVRLSSNSVLVMHDDLHSS